jgi:hypothetical protein
VSWLVEELVGATRRLIATVVFVVVMFFALGLVMALLAGACGVLLLASGGGH